MRRLSRRRRKVNKVLKKIKVVWIVKAILYGLGVYAFLYCQREYASALISFKAIIIIGIISGIIASLIVEREFKYYLFSVILLGSLFTGILFKLNRTFVHAKEEKIKVRILDKAMRSAKTEHSAVTIEYNDFDRDIYIEGNQEHLLGPSSFIVLTVRKGGLGYYIITYKELVK